MDNGTLSVMGARFFFTVFLLSHYIDPGYARALPSKGSVCIFRRDIIVQPGPAISLRKVATMFWLLKLLFWVLKLPLALITLPFKVIGFVQQLMLMFFAVSLIVMIVVILALVTW